MKKKLSPVITGLILVTAGLLATLFLLSQPLWEFTAGLYTKKSGNTFVGDEKYIAARAEAEAVLADYQSKGMEVSLNETVTERVNSKGKTTSMVAFSISQTFHRSGIDLLKSGLTPGRVLAVLTALLLLGCIAAFAGGIPSRNAEYRVLPKGSRAIRKTACVLFLLALLLVPVFSMSGTVLFNRTLPPVLENSESAGADELIRKMDLLLWNGTAGEEAAERLSGMSEQVASLWWLMLPAVMFCLFGSILSAWGETGKVLRRGLLYASVIVICVVTLYPFWVMFITAFRRISETNDMYFTRLLPTEWVWTNFGDIIERDMHICLLNSVLVSTGTTLLALLCGIPAAYAMARMRFRMKKAYLGFIIMSQMFSPVVLLVGVSRLMSYIGLADNLWGLIFLNAAFNQAFAIWLLRGTFVSISPEMEQAARIDGCNTVQSLIRILLPMAAPGIVTTLIFVFINAWNEFTLSSVLISSNANKPITIGIRTYSSFNDIDWPHLFTASLLATLPVVGLFMCIEKHLVSGLTSGGVKG